MDWEAKFFTSGDARIRYVEVGAGEPVVLLHGFTGSIEHHWVRTLMGGNPAVVPQLRRDYRVIALDCRGHGGSSKPHDPSGYGRELVLDVVRLLDHLQIERAHVLGYSMGSMITGRLLASYPERLRSAVLAAYGIRRVGYPDGVIEDDVLVASLEGETGLLPLLSALLAEGPRRPSPQQLNLFNQTLLRVNDPQALAALVRSWDALSVTDAELRANSVPSLVLIGERDPLLPQAELLPEVLNRSELRVLPRADHMSMLVLPEFAAAVKEFFDRQRGLAG